MSGNNASAETVAGFSVGFIGLGGMGRGVVKNMLAGGAAVSVHDLDPEAVALAVSQGAKAEPDLAAMAASVDVLGICITTAEAVQKLALGPDGLLSRMKKGAVFLDHTTVSPDHVDKMREACAACSVAYCEAPMTRTPVHADRGEVNILFGGTEALLERLRPLFETYAENIFHVGPAGWISTARLP